jgi:hypothetical protein
MGRRALPERLVAVGPWTHHRSTIKIRMGWRVGGRGCVTCRPFAHSKTLFRAFAHASAEWQKLSWRTAGVRFLSLGLDCDRGLALKLLMRGHRQPL